MNEKKFNQILQEKLTNHDSHVPGDMWSKIEKDLVRRKSRPLLPFIISGLALMSVVFYFVLNSSLVNEQTRRMDENQVEYSVNETARIHQEAGIEMSASTSQRLDQKQILTNEAPKSNDDLNVNQDDGVAKATSAYEEGAQNKKTSSVRTPTSPFASAFSSKDSHSSSIRDNTSVSDQRTQRFEQTNPNKNTQEPELASNDRNNHDKVKQMTLKDEAPIKKTEHIQNASQSHKNENTEFLNLNEDGKASLDKTNTADPISIDKDADLVESKNSTFAVAKLPWTGNSQSLATGHFVYDPCAVKGGKKKNRVHCYSFVQQNTLIFADFMAGPQYSHKLLNVKSNRGSFDYDLDELLNDRKETESFMFSYNATARIGIKLKSGLTGTAGLSLDRFHERFDYYDPNQTRTTVTHVLVDTMWETDNQGNVNVIYTWEPMSIESKGQHTVKHTNTLTFISIPLTAGYTWQMDKFNVGINSGVSVNLLFGKQGRIVDPGGAVSSLNGSGSDDEFKAWAGIGLMGGFVFEYKMKKGLSFIAEPQFKYQLSNIGRSTYGLEQKYVQAGINVGLRKVLSERISHKKKYGVN